MMYLMDIPKIYFKLIIFTLILPQFILAETIIKDLQWNKGLPAVIQSQPSPQAIAVNISDAQINLDGNLDESVWQKATFLPASSSTVSDAPFWFDKAAKKGSAQYGNFLWPRLLIRKKLQAVAENTIGEISPIRVSQQTSVRILFNSNAIYFGIVCYENKISDLKVVESDDSPFLWKDDCIEIFFDPTASGRGYVQFITNASGKRTMIYALGGTGPKIIPGAQWNSVVLRKNDRWIAEICIPFKTIGQLPDDGTVWRFNIGREEQPHQEISSWKEMFEVFERPESFGELVFGRPSSIQMSLAVPEFFGIGHNNITVKLQKSDSHLLEGTVYCDITSHNKQIARAETSWDASGKSSCNMPIILTSGEETVIFIQVSNKNQQFLSYPMSIKVAKEQLDVICDSNTIMADQHVIKTKLRFNLGEKEFSGLQLKIINTKGDIAEIPVKGCEATLSLFTGQLKSGQPLRYEFILLKNGKKIANKNIEFKVLESPF